MEKRITPSTLPETNNPVSPINTMDIYALRQTLMQHVREEPLMLRRHLAGILHDRAKNEGIEAARRMVEKQTGVIPRENEELRLRGESLYVRDNDK